MEHITLPNLFFQKALENSDKPFLWAKKEGEWESLSWQETEKKVKQLAAGLKYNGILPGDKVIIVSENRPECLISDLAINTLNAITVPAYTTNTEDDHRYIIEHSDAKAVIVSNNILANRIALALNKVETPISLSSTNEMSLPSSVVISSLPSISKIPPLEYSFSQRFAISGWLACKYLLCFSDWKGISFSDL